MSSPTIQIMRCPPEARGQALDVLYHALERRMRGALVAAALEDERLGRVDLSGLWIAVRAGWSSSRIVGALLTQRLPGKAAAFWTPQTPTVWNRAEIAASLVRGALAGLRESGVAIAQAVFDVSTDPRGGEDLARGGMPRVTDLIYLQRPVSPPPPPSARPGSVRLQWRGVDEVGVDVLRETLTSTYAGSLDMPELEGARSTDDVLEGHRGASGHRADRWRLGFEPGAAAPSAVLLMAPAPDREQEAWEVVYLGLAPRARGRGLGGQIVEHALEITRPHAGAVELAVDVRNAPAVRLYSRAGFLPFDRRAVHLAILARAGVSSDGPAPPLP